MTKTETIEWRWMSLVEAGILSRANQGIESGWVGETASESTDDLSLYVWGDRQDGNEVFACLEWGSLMMELDARTWEEGKRVCEVMLRHARALNAELSHG
jgi:hypothetical protein